MSECEKCNDKENYIKDLENDLKLLEEDIKDLKDEHEIEIKKVELDKKLRGNKNETSKKSKIYIRL